MGAPVIRQAVEADIPELMEMILALAEHHDEADSVRNTPDRLKQNLFSERPSFTVHVVEAPAESEFRLNGFSLWFPAYSTWEGARLIHMEDLYVRPESRGTGAGKALLANLARIAVDDDYQRIEWMVAKTNEPGIRFYLAQGASAMSEWESYQVKGDQLKALAGA